MTLGGSFYRPCYFDRMPFTRHYLPSRNFILTRVVGRIDDSELREHVLALNSEAADLRATLEIADCREVNDVEHLFGGVDEMENLQVLWGYIAAV